MKRPSSNSSITNADEGSRNIHFPAGNGYVCNGNCHDSREELLVQWLPVHPNALGQLPWPSRLDLIWESKPLHLCNLESAVDAPTPRTYNTLICTR